MSRLVKLSTQLPTPKDTKPPSWLDSSTSLGQRMSDTTLPVPVAASGGLFGALQKRMGFPSFKGNYTPAQFKAPAYGGDAALKNEVSKADAYRFRAKLPPIYYDGIWEPRALLQGSAIDKSIGFVPTTGTKNPVFLGEKDPKDAMTGLTPKAMEAELFMSDKNIDSAMRTGQYAPNLLEAMMGEDANNMKDKRPIARQWGALARSQGVEPAYANLQQVLKTNLAQSTSGGHPTDGLQGLDEVLGHEMGHTWLNNPRASRNSGIDLLRGTLPNKDEPFEVTEHRADLAKDELSRMIDQSGWGEYHPLRSLVGHDADLPELLNYGSALQQHMFKTRGSRLETPEAVEGWMNSLMSQPNERAFEENLKQYPFDVRRMMRHNWRLQQGSGNEAKRQMLDSLKERMKLWFPALVDNGVQTGQTKQAGLLKSIGGFVRKLNYAPVRDAQHAILNARIDKGLADLASKPGRTLAPGHAEKIRQHLLRSLDELGPRVVKPLPVWDATKRRLDMELLGLGNSLQDSLVPPLTEVFRSGLPAGSRALYRDYGRAIKAHNEAWGKLLGLSAGVLGAPLWEKGRHALHDSISSNLGAVVSSMAPMGSEGVKRDAEQWLRELRDKLPVLLHSF